MLSIDDELICPFLHSQIVQTVSSLTGHLQEWSGLNLLVKLCSLAAEKDPVDDLIDLSSPPFVATVLHHSQKTSLPIVWD